MWMPCKRPFETDGSLAQCWQCREQVETLATTVHILNTTLMTCSAQQDSIWGLFGTKPNVSHFRMFGCNACVHVLKKIGGTWIQNPSRCNQSPFQRLQVVMKSLMIYVECDVKVRGHQNQKPHGVWFRQEWSNCRFWCRVRWVYYQLFSMGICIRRWMLGDLQGLWSLRIQRYGLQVEEPLVLGWGCA